MNELQVTYVLQYIFLLSIVIIGCEPRNSITEDHVGSGVTVDPEFSRHSIIRPRIFHGREKRELSTTRDEDGAHVHDLMVNFVDEDGRDWLLDLQLNRELITKSYFEKFQHSGHDVVNRPTGIDLDHCHYKGSVRGKPDSWVAISTCKGFSGVIFDGDDLHYIEPGEKNNSMLHVLYRHEHLLSNHTCGFPDTPQEYHIHEEAHRILRYKRSNDENGSRGVIHKPHNANKQSRYVELLLVVDTMEYKEFGNMPDISLHCKKIVNIINALYVPLNIFVALVGVVVWTEHDDIVLSPVGDTTLANFLHYRRGRLAKEHPNDNAQLLTRMQFDGGVVGKALKGPICTYEYSGGVNVDHSSVVGLVATTIAHEMGHNFGMEHDTSDCHCPSERCIMAHSSNSKHPTHWSSCSLQYLAHAFEHGMDYCLRNKPEKLFESSVCGNGFVEPGEQCDCGLPEFCNNPCCNATTCMLFSNASCATGECCDLTTCKPRRAGYPCRTADHECDLPEYCIGDSEFCPNNVFKMDGEKCEKGRAYCYQGSCRTHSDQCRLLWGPSGENADAACYDMNTKGNQHGNCGYNRLNHSYTECSNENIMCGMLHCRHYNERLEFGMESLSILSQVFLNIGRNVIPCRTAIIDLGLDVVDPGLAPDGAKCGEGKMCVNRKCVAIEALQKATCPSNCNGRGVCNSKGHCHCDIGYAPPNCSDVGFGGSSDSGPATDPHAESGTTKFLIFMFAVIFMCIILLLAVFYTRYWQTKRKSTCNNVGLTGSSSHVRTEKDGRSAVNISSPLSSGDSVCTSLLTNSNEPVLNGLTGKHKGFTFTPLSSPLEPSALMLPSAHVVQSGVAVPTRPAPSVVTANPASSSIPIRPAPSSVPTRPVPSSAPTRPAPTAVPTRPAPTAVPTRSASARLPLISSETSVPKVSNNLNRPTISSPILGATTLTAQQLISNAVPMAGTEPREIRLPKQVSESSQETKVLRQAPLPPSAPAGYIPLAVSSPIKQPRPSSSPTVQAHIITEPAPSNKVKEGSSTLSRIASMFHHGSKNNAGGKTKLDREALRSLEISEPIPQQEIEISSATDAPANRPVVMRAHSLRTQGPVTPRPNIPNFGSMRSRRPVSLPTTRPTSPPPRPPPFKPATTVEYDDCLNVQSSAPLANIDEEMPSPGDNIYAVIEECPPLTTAAQDTKKLNYTSPTGEYQSPRPVENTISAGSTESVGLLSEIVNEMQARNMESIYTSTLGRKRKKKEDESKATDGKSSSKGSPTSPKNVPMTSRFPDRASTISTSNSSLGTYVNAPYTTNKPGMYTNISSRNSPTPSQGSSQAGYLSPNPVVSAPPLPLSLPVVTTSAPTATTQSFSTFKGPNKSAGDTGHTLTSPPTSFGSYKSMLQRPSGPLSGLHSNTPTNQEEKKKSTPKPVDISNSISTSQTSKPPSSSVVKSVLAAVENSKKKDVSKPSSRSSSIEKKSPTESKLPENEKKTGNIAVRTATNMANRPLPEKPMNAQKAPQVRTKSIPATTTKPSAPVAAGTLTGMKNKTGVSQNNTCNKVPPTPPSPQKKPSNKSSPDVVASCGREQGNREPDVLSPAGNSSKNLLERQTSSESRLALAGVMTGNKRAIPASANRGASHVASLQQKFESACGSKPSGTSVGSVPAVKNKNLSPVNARSFPDSASNSK